MTSKDDIQGLVFLKFLHTLYRLLQIFRQLVTIRQIIIYHSYIGIGTVYFFTAAGIFNS
jgi:hypothetical protein